MVPLPYLYERAFNGDIAKRFTQLAGLLRLRPLTAFEMHEVLGLTHAMADYPGVFSVETNIPNYKSGKDINPHAEAICYIGSFHKVENYSQPSILMSVFNPMRISLRVRPFPLKINTAHIQYRHGEDRADTPLHFGDREFRDCFVLGLLMCKAADEAFPEGLTSSAMLPLNGGLLLGEIRPKVSVASENDFYIIEGKRNQQARQGSFVKLTNVDWSPKHELVMHTLIGPKQMRTYQRKIHETLSALIAPNENYDVDYIVNFIKARFTFGQSFSKTVTYSKQQMHKMEARLGQGVVAKRQSGQVTINGKTVFRNGFTSDEADVVNKILDGLKETLMSDDWKTSKAHLPRELSRPVLG